LEKLEQIDKFDGLYETEEYLDDFLTLENQFFPLYKKVDLGSSYESLLKRVSKYTEGITAQELEVSQRKVLAFLYASAQSKVSSLNCSSEKYLIIDIEKYIRTVAIPNIQDLRTANKEVSIERQARELRARLEGSIREANEYIEKEVTSGIEDAVKELAADVALLVNEIKELLKKGEEKRDELLRIKEQLRKKMMWSTIFGVVKVIGMAACLCGPAGAAVEAVIAAGASIAEKIVLDKDEAGQEIPITVPKGATDSVNAMSKYLETRRDEKAAGIKSQIKEIENLVKKEPELLFDLQTTVENVKKQLDAEVSSSPQDFESVFRVVSLLKELESTFKASQETVDSEAEKGNQKASKILDEMKKVRVGSVFVDTFIKYRSDSDAIDAMSASLAVSGEDIRILHLFEESVYRKLVPMLSGMANNIEEMNRTLGTKSQVGLDVSRWKIQSTLKEIMVEVGAMTKGFEVEDKFRRSIDKLSEALVMLINIYDRIQTFREKQLELNFIANIASPGSASIDLTESPYGPYVLELDQIIHCNLVLTEFEQVANAFKQWAFPFAHSHMSMFYLPENLQPTNLDQVVSQAVLKVKEIQGQLNKNRSTILPYDKFLEKGDFAPNGLPNPPFYTWTHRDFEREISNLLLGLPITLLADIDKDPNLKDSTKFSRI
jgi:uncharacterized membrane protein